MREFPSYHGKAGHSGAYFSATVMRHVGYESWLERDNLILQDFDPEVIGISAQPFCLYWLDGDRFRAHAPDYFVLRTDGTKVVVDVRGDGDRASPPGMRISAAYAAMDQACEQVGWVHRLAGTPPAGPDE